jgi:SAM-dependent methyltransferase
MTLDAGCGGEGGFIWEVLNKGGSFPVGLDVNETALKSTKSNVLVSKGVSLVRGTVTNMPFRDGSFGQVLCCEVLEHVVDDDLAIAEISRVLKRAGHAIITVPHTSWTGLAGPRECACDRHVRAGYDMKGFAKILDQKSLRVESSKSVVGPIGRLGVIFNERMIAVRFRYPVVSLLLTVFELVFLLLFVFLTRFEDLLPPQHGATLVFKSTKVEVG